MSVALKVSVTVYSVYSPKARSVIIRHIRYNKRSVIDTNPKLCYSFDI